MGRSILRAPMAFLIDDQLEAMTVADRIGVPDYLCADTFAMLSRENAGQITVRVNGFADHAPGDRVGLTVPDALLLSLVANGLALRGACSGPDLHFRTEHVSRS